ncbi:MAG: SGNH/GDSL hydrolase family protein, partial [Planctomycetota bacterium]|nr:SGNH/GDSL hydrolase family protein [Planctomycetota bacterium]
MPDEDVVRRRTLLSNPENWLQRMRIMRVARQLIPSMRVPMVESDDAKAPVRVTPDQYDANLEAIVRSAEANGCFTILMTAPSDFKNGSMPDWSYPFFRDFYHMSEADVDAIPTVHEQYVDIARNVAGRFDSAMVIDGARLWAEEPGPGRFRRDCIHLTEYGHAQLANLLLETSREQIDRIVAARQLSGRSEDAARPSSD